MIARQVAVNQKVKIPRRLSMTIPATLPWMTADIMLNADMAVRSPRITIMTIRRTRACPSGVWMKLYEDGEKVRNPRSLLHLAAAGVRAGRAGRSSGKYQHP